MVIAGVTGGWVLLAWGTAILAVPLVRTIYTQSGRPLNKALAATGQLELLFGLLFSLGLILGNKNPRTLSKATTDYTNLAKANEY